MSELNEKQKATLNLYYDYRFGFTKEEFDKEIDKIGLSHQELDQLLKEDYLYYLAPRDLYIITMTGWKYMNGDMEP